MWSEQLKNGKTISTHILTRRMTTFLSKQRIPLHISTHILTRRMTIQTPLVALCSTFQLTSSRGGWQRKAVWKLLDRYFNSHPHEEDDPCRHRCSSRRTHFNSHPHEEDDGLLKTIEHIKSISTHILTRRMTCFSEVLRWSCCISTHILTRRMTFYRCFDLRCFIFQLTSSRGGWQSLFYQKKEYSYFNSHPHEEDDYIHLVSLRFYWISTHILTRRMTWENEFGEQVW